MKWLLAKGARAVPKDLDSNYAMQRAEQEGQLEVRDLILRAFEKELKCVRDFFSLQILK